MATGSASPPLYVVTTASPSGTVVTVAPCGEPSYTWLKSLNKIPALGFVTAMACVTHGATS